MIKTKGMKLVFAILAIFCATIVFAQRPSLRFQDHKFKIVQFTDLHWTEGVEYASGNDSTLNLMRKVIEREHPDLVIFTGDAVVHGNAETGWRQVIRPVTEAKVPFAVTFGNHDTETNLSKAQILDILQRNPLCLTSNAKKINSGKGTCALPVISSDGQSMPWAIYLFDSNAYPVSRELLGNYDWIHNDQIQWYRKQSEAYQRREGKAISALAFFHIPFPEFETVRNQKSTIGSTEETVCSPDINSGLFSSFVEMGDVIGVFVGHDHNNDFVGTLRGVCLAYGRKTGHISAYNETLKRGARIIELNENGKGFDTHIRTISGRCQDYSFSKE